MWKNNTTNKLLIIRVHIYSVSANFSAFCLFFVDLSLNVDIPHITYFSNRLLFYIWHIFLDFMFFDITNCNQLGRCIYRNSLLNSYRNSHSLLYSVLSYKIQCFSHIRNVGLSFIHQAKHRWEWNGLEAVIVVGLLPCHDHSCTLEVYRTCNQVVKMKRRQ